MDDDRRVEITIWFVLSKPGLKANYYGRFSVLFSWHILCSQRSCCRAHSGASRHSMLIALEFSPRAYWES